jgi:vitamin B12 transporter
MQVMYVFIRYIIASLLLWVCSTEYLCAQINTDSVYVMPIVQIQGYRYDDFSAGNKTVAIDTTYLQQNPGSLANVLENQSGIFIKSYGVSSLASITVRGGSASQTQATMNGMILNSPTTGQIDYSTVPSFIFNDLKIQYGSQVSLMGSGAIGGSIHLSNTADFVKRKQISLEYQQASFGSMLPIVRMRFGDSLQQLYVAAYYKQAKNDITYYKQSEKTTLNHAQQQQAGTYIDYSIRLKNHTIKYWMWYQQLDRNIPGTISAAYSDARQYDRNWKQGLQWMYSKRRTELQARIGYQSDKMTYASDTSDIHSKIASSLIQSELEYRYQFNSNIKILIGSQFIAQQAVSENFIEPTVEQNRIGFFISSNIKCLSKKLIWVPSIRKEWMKNWIPLTPSLGVDYHLSSSLKVHGLASYNYRSPSLNDLYWNPGGNPTLEPEHGWSYEVGAAYQKTIKKNKVFQDVTVYTRNIENWILWVPNNGLWTPENIQRVWSRGVELETKIAVPIQKSTLQFRNSFAYTKSTNETDYTTADDRAGKQLIYVPLYKNSFTTTLQLKKVNIGGIYNYTSWSFINSDNSDYINPYNLFDVFTTVFLKTNKSNSSLSVNARINNIFNTTYQVMASRPMPLRNYQLTLTYTFN